MKDNLEPQVSHVRRITIDEKLEDDLIRILIADLNRDVTTFSDDYSHWGEEYEDFIRPNDYQSKIGITENDIKKWPWENLYEGLVFLVGSFNTIDDQNTFIVNKEPARLLHFDPHIKKEMRKKFLTAEKEYMIWRDK